MKRILLVLGVAFALAGCGGGGGGGSSTPHIPSNPGGPTPGPSSPPASPTPLPTATNAPATVVVGATSSPFIIKKTAINPASTSTNGGALTITGTGMSAGAALYATVSSNDKSGSTCLELIPQGQTSGTPCSYPAAGSTPAPVGITKSGDQVAVQYNNGPTPPTGSMNITVTANGGTGPVNPFSMNYPAPAVGQNTSGTINPWGGGVAYSNGNIYFTVNSASSPLGSTTYSNGTAGANVSYVTASPALTNAPAGGLIIGPDNNFWGTEQNATKAFSMSPSGTTHEYTISCPSGSSADNASHTGLLGPQTGITTDGTNIYVLCADVAHKTDGGNNTVNTITTSGNVTSCSLKSGGGTPAGPFANGATFSGGNILTEESTGATGGGAGGASSGVWISIPATNCGNFTEFANSAITGSGNVWLLGGSLYSETDNLSASTAFAGATVANPKFNIFAGGGGLAMDTVLGSGFFVGTADNHDAQILTKWTGGSMITVDASNPSYVPLSASSGSAMTAGTCEVAFNSGGGMGIVQLPDGKFAWPDATEGLETGRNYVCFLNP